MKRMLAFMLCLLMSLSMMAGCGQTKTDEGGAGAESGVTAPAQDVAMQYITVQEALEVLGTDGYTFLDVRKAEDYKISHIPGAVEADMDAAKNGDFDAGVSTMQVAPRDLDDNLVIICYSGKSYAQGTTNVLSALGYDMSKVYTLEGGFTAWSEAYPDQVTAE